MTTFHRILGAVAATGAAALVLSGCVAKSDVGAAAAFDVSSTDADCAVSATTAKSGTLTFDVKNDTDQVSEFYLLADDGLRIVGEVENIAPAASRTLTVVAQPGDYFTLCKPGMIGEGVGKTAFTVTGDRVAVDGPDAEQKKAAVDLYAAFVKDQVGQLVPAVEDFVAAYESGDDETARALFPQVRAYYERIEPVAEALGDLDPRIDYREVDRPPELFAEAYAEARRAGLKATAHAGEFGMPWTNVRTALLCLIYKIDCETVEGLDLHSQTREHQKTRERQIDYHNH